MNIHGLAILIVEDEPFIRDDLSDFFTDAGYLVFEAGDADEAIVLLEANPIIRIVLTDVQMPGSMDGVRLAHHVRDRYPPTLLILASGAVRPTIQELPIDALFFPKPFNPHAVLRAIRQAA